MAFVVALGRILYLLFVLVHLRSAMRVGVNGLKRLAPSPPILIKQYNILAGYLGHNTEPWFLLGANISAAQRALIMNNFYRKDITGKYIHNFANDKFGADADGDPLLNEAQAEAVIATDENVFAWSLRKHKLVHEMLRGDPDILVLEELDHYDFFNNELAQHGYASVWSKRPRATSDDGSGIFWKTQRFELRGNESFLLQDAQDLADVVPPMRGKKRLAAAAALKNFMEDPAIKKRWDRVALVAALRDKLEDNRTLVVLAAHLQRNPEEEINDYVRLGELHQLFDFVDNFAQHHQLSIEPESWTASDKFTYRTPRDALVLAGDLNSQRVGHGTSYTKAAAIVRQLTNGMVCSAFLGDIQGDDGCTTRTDARSMWIDYLFYSGVALKVPEVFKDPCPPGPIPDAAHPSDHVPVAMRMSWRDVVEASFEGQTNQVGLWESFCSPPAIVQPFE